MGGDGRGGALDTGSPHRDKLWMDPPLVFSRQADRNCLEGDDNFETERLVCDRIVTMKHGG